MDGIFDLIFFAVFVLIFVAPFFIAPFFQSKSNSEQNRSNVSTNKPHSSFVSERKVVEKPKPVTPSLVFHDDDHDHYGDAETYDKIVGSLGEVSDEGCDELDGVRLIANDVAYSYSSDEGGVDTDKLSQFIVWGEILNEPRFKKGAKR